MTNNREYVGDYVLCSDGIYRYKYIYTVVADKVAIVGHRNPGHREAISDIIIDIVKKEG